MKNLDFTAVVKVRDRSSRTAQTSADANLESGSEIGRLSKFSGDFSVCGESFMKI